MEQEPAPMSDEELIGYSALHCKTPRALFIGRHVNRMIDLAGADFEHVNPEEWFSLHEEMEELVTKARARRKVVEDQKSVATKFEQFLAGLQTAKTDHPVKILETMRHGYEFIDLIGVHGINDEFLLRLPAETRKAAIAAFVALTIQNITPKR